MKTSNPDSSNEYQRFQPLVEGGYLSGDQVLAAARTAEHLGVEIEHILRYQYDIPRRRILEALSEHYQCRWAEYDERAPVPPELLRGLDAQRLCLSRWLPIIKDGKTIVIAAHDPHDPLVRQEVESTFPGEVCEFRIALVEDILAFIQDYLNGPPEHIIGNERTGLAYWRNTMARWRTRLACYRTAFARVRTHFSLLRGGLSLIVIGRTLLKFQGTQSQIFVHWLMIATGFGMIVLGLSSYVRIKKSSIRPPRHQTLVEVTAATLYFLEGYQFVENKPEDSSPKLTMLSRLYDTLPNNCVFIEPSLDNKVRSYLAHERTSLAAQRTIAACYRTIYARARTGLSFIRTGVAFAGIGCGLVEYFGISALTVLDSFIIVSGLLMVVDGAIWYWPVRKEQCEAGKCAVVL